MWTRGGNWVDGKRRIVVAFVVAMFAAGGAASAGPHAGLDVPPPGVTEAIDWEAVSRQVEIRRDTFGIPHIRAANELAAAYGFGYAQAEDHMVEIARQMLRARGEAAMHFGEAEVDNDLAMHRFDNMVESRRALDRISPLFRDIVRGYAAGVNAYASQQADALPDWVPVLTETDVLALIRSRAVFPLISPKTISAIDARHAARRVPVAVQPQSEGPGSNAFALAGSRTASGSPILLANPHLNWSSLYWEAHVTVPGVIDFFGNTLAGYPVLWAGFNETLGWANTVSAADLDDIYRLSMDPVHADGYMFDGRQRMLSPRQVQVRVRENDGSLSLRKQTYWDSHLGPIVHRQDGQAYAVKSSRLDAPLQFEGFYRLARTRNLDEFRQVFRQFPVFSCNFIYGDVDGNIFYLWHAMLPRRPDDGTDYSLDVPGDSSKYVWTSLHSADEMPYLLNPPDGIVQNANNPPWWASPRDHIDPARYPGYFQRGPLALRPQLSLDLLQRKRKYSVQDVVDLNFSTRLLLAERVLPDLLSALQAQADRDEALASALDVLARWDRGVDAGSRGAVLFLRFWETYAGELAQPFAQPWAADAATTTPRGLADPALALRHLRQAMHWTRTRHGSESVAWGDVHRLRLRGLDLPGSGADGAHGTFHVMRYAQASDGTLMMGVESPGSKPIGFGDNWVMLVEFSRPVRAWSVLAQGQSGRWDSSHSNDQLRLFHERRLRPVWFSEQEIRDNLERRYHPAVVRAFPPHQKTVSRGNPATLQPRRSRPEPP
jgi:acyl-homoserine-lactone acylase